jgi:hypothetical protein
VLAYEASVLTDSRHGLVVPTAVGHATGTDEVDAEQMLSGVSGEQTGRTEQRTAGSDTLCDQHGFVHTVRELAFTAHVARNDHPTHPSAIEAHLPREPRYAESTAGESRSTGLRPGERWWGCWASCGTAGRDGASGLGVHLHDADL